MIPSRALAEARHGLAVFFVGLGCRNAPAAPTGEPVGIELTDPAVGTYRVAVLVSPPAAEAQTVPQFASALAPALRRCATRDGGATVELEFAACELDAVDGRLAYDAAHPPPQEFSRCLARSLDGAEVAGLRGARRKVNLEFLVGRGSGAAPRR